MAEVTRLELATSCVTGKHSNQLSYTSIKMVAREGFEPSKAEPADLQSAPFGHSGISPHGAAYRIRTNYLLITSQLLYLVS